MSTVNVAETIVIENRNHRQDLPFAIYQHEMAKVTNKGALSCLDGNRPINRLAQL